MKTRRKVYESIKVLFALTAYQETGVTFCNNNNNPILII